MNYYVNKILQEKSITSFLEERNIYPQKKSGEKSFYLCPIHQGDTSPSFIVYPAGTKGRDYQTYYCFSCHSGITLINLKSDLDKVSTKESLKHFMKGVEINHGEAKKSIVDDYKKGELGIERNNDIESIMLFINSTCRRHIVECDYDDEEIDFFEIFFEKVDKIARSRNLNTLEEVYDILLRGIDKRVENYIKRQEDTDISSLSWKI